MPKKTPAVEVPEFDQIVIMLKGDRMRALYGKKKGEPDKFLCSFMTPEPEAFVVPAIESHYGIKVKEASAPAKKSAPKKASATKPAKATKPKPTGKASGKGTTGRKVARTK